MNDQEEAHLAYRLAARKPQSPSRAAGGVRHRMLVAFTMCCRKSVTSGSDVLTATCRTHESKIRIKGKKLQLSQCDKKLPDALQEVTSGSSDAATAACAKLKQQSISEL